jgi:hypothetical protein
MVVYVPGELKGKEKKKEKRNFYKSALDVE